MESFSDNCSRKSLKLARTSKLVCFCWLMLLLHGETEGNVDKKRADKKTSKSQHGLGFLSLGSKTFATAKEDKYRNNLVLTSIKNAEKLNATCIGKMKSFRISFFVLSCCINHSTRFIFFFVYRSLNKERYLFLLCCSMGEFSRFRKYFITCKGVDKFNLLTQLVGFFSNSVYRMGILSMQKQRTE